MCRIVICGLSRSTIYFHIISQTARFSERSYWTQRVCFFFCTSLYKTFLIPRKIQGDTVINIRTSSCEVPVILVRFHKSWIFSTVFRKTLAEQISWQSVRWELGWAMWTYREAGRRTGGQAGRWAGGQAGRRAGGQAGRRAGGQAGRRAGGQAGRHDEANCRFWHFYDPI
jgi:hypothetical protein